MNLHFKKYSLNKAGFTLFELLAVMMILGILVAIAVPSYQRNQIKARESVLAEDLYQIRRSIDAFYSDNARYPDSIKELQYKKYLRNVPVDPFTLNSHTWRCVPPTTSDDGRLAAGNCFDVRSSSELVGLNDIPYRDW
jgi:general secretion pathway protein G